MPPPRIAAAVAHGLKRARAVVLAVSGGLDSMVLLHLAALSRERGRIAAIATFDHGTGAVAERASQLVAQTAANMGFAAVVGRSATGATDEASWRNERWTFLQEVSGRLDARVMTAHTLDDQIETVFMRILRGSGTRGLAGLLAESDVHRPLLEFSRAELAAWAAAAGVAYVEDPTNESRRFLRNRVRLEILPAIERVNPGFRAEVQHIGERAAEWRADVERLIKTLDATIQPGHLVVQREALTAYDRDGLGVLWPALAAHAGVVLDRRGTERLVAFTSGNPVTGARIQLAGGAEVVARRDEWLLRRVERTDESTYPLRDGLSLGAWRFHTQAREPVLGPDLMHADLPVELPLTVRVWRAGDRIRLHEGQGTSAESRKVKRYLADARIVGPERRGWPVVIAGDEIVWIPGVCRSDAATVRSGRPAVRFVCEHIIG